MELDPFDFLLTGAPAAQIVTEPVETLTLEKAWAAVNVARDAVTALYPNIVTRRGGLPLGHPVRVAAEERLDLAIARLCDLWDEIDPDPQRGARRIDSAPAPVRVPDAEPAPLKAVDQADAAEAARRRTARAARTAAGTR